MTITIELLQNEIETCDKNIEGAVRVINMLSGQIREAEANIQKFVGMQEGHQKLLQELLKTATPETIGGAPTPAATEPGTPENLGTLKLHSIKNSVQTKARKRK